MDELKIISSLASVNDLPFNRPCSKKAAQKEVLKFINLACELYSHMQTMHRPSLETLRHQEVMPLEILLGELKKIAMMAAEQAKNIQGTSEKKGRKENTQIPVVVKYLTRKYENETGKKATRRNTQCKEYLNTGLKRVALEQPKSPRGKKGHRTSVDSQLKKVVKK